MSSSQGRALAEPTPSQGWLGGMLALVPRRGWSVAALVAALFGATAWSARGILKKRLRTKKVSVEGLFIYPIKGCHGHAVTRAEVTTWGLQGDRLYMIVTEDGKFYSQRENARLALVRPSMPTAEGITLRAPHEGRALELFVKRASKPKVSVQCWKDVIPAVDQGDEVARWLQSFLGKEGLRLVRIDDSAHRAIDAKYGVGETGFSDAFPILVTSQASVKRVAKGVSTGIDISITRFRSNVHVSGCGPFEEDEMPALALGPRGAGPALQLHLVKPCSRCTVPNIDQETAEKSQGGEPRKSMANYRRGRALQNRAELHRSFFAEEKHHDEIYFGQNALPKIIGPGVGNPVIEVGDTLDVMW